MEHFSHLSPADKLESILAANLRPCPRNVALELADIDIDALDESTRRNVEEVLRRWKVADQGQTSPLYWVPKEQQDEVMNRIGVEQKSVYAQIANLGFKMFGIE